MGDLGVPEVSRRMRSSGSARSSLWTATADRLRAMRQKLASEEHRRHVMPGVARWTTCPTLFGRRSVSLCAMEKRLTKPRPVNYLPSWPRSNRVISVCRVITCGAQRRRLVAVA